MDKIYIYADGGCRGNQHKTNIGGYGVVLQYKGKKKELKGAVKNTTNNIMELTACIVALKEIKDRTIPVVLTTDSSYVVNGINIWIHNWIKREWLKADRKPVENKELWEELYSLKQKFRDVTFVHCKGHSTNEGNNRADKLANEAMDAII